MMSVMTSYVAEDYDLVWDGILDQIEAELAVIEDQREVFAEWRDEVDWDILMWEREANEYWRSEIETVDGAEDLL
jgi:hypothetical protein